MIRAVLDANIFVSAAIRPEGPPGKLLRRFLTDQAFELVMSPSIAAEIVAALRYPSVRKCLRSTIDPGRWEAIMLLADIVEDTVLPRPVSQDPDDDKFLAAAVIGRASVVVSGDRHLLSLVQHEDIRVIPPKAFLDLLDRA